LYIILIIIKFNELAVDYSWVGRRFRALRIGCERVLIETAKERRRGKKLRKES